MSSKIEDLQVLRDLKVDADQLGEALDDVSLAELAALEQEFAAPVVEQPIAQDLSDGLAGLFTKGFLDDRMVSDIAAVVRKHAAPAVESLVGRTGGGMVWHECAVCHAKGSYHPDVKWCICGRHFDTAPVVERQPVYQANYVGDVGAWRDLEPDQYKRFATLEHYQVRTLYTAPPELAELQAEVKRLKEAAELSAKVGAPNFHGKNREIKELQATIARLTSENERLKSEPVDGLRSALAECITQRDALKVEIEQLTASRNETMRALIKQRLNAYTVDETIERLKAGQGEPVALYPRCTILKDCNVRASAHSQPSPVSKQEAATLIASYLAAGRSEGHVAEVARAIIALASTTDNLF